MIDNMFKVGDFVKLNNRLYTYDYARLKDHLGMIWESPNEYHDYYTVFFAAVPNHHCNGLWLFTKNELIKC